MTEMNHKERLEQELNFLKESFEADIISKEEYEKGKDRIERKLREEHGKEEPAQGQSAEKKEEKTILGEDKKEPAEARPDAHEIEEHKGDYHAEESHSGNSRFYIYASIFIVIVLAILMTSLIISGGKKGEAGEKESLQGAKEILTESAGSESAGIESASKVAMQSKRKVNVIVLNDRDECPTCETDRILSILESWVGQISVKEIDVNTYEGNSLADSMNARLIPAYILDENISTIGNFEQFRQVFLKKNNSYVLSDDASASKFYFRREKIENRLDFFALSGDNSSLRAEKNVKQFLDAFKDVKYEKHFANDALTKDLGIRSFPSFVVNNRLKLTGVNPAESIKEAFCSANKLEACRKNLSRSLI